VENIDEGGPVDPEMVHVKVFEEANKNTLKQKKTVRVVTKHESASPGKSNASPHSDDSFCSDEDMREGYKRKTVMQK
jgi:hypothetical protein